MLSVLHLCSSSKSLEDAQSLGVRSDFFQRKMRAPLSMRKIATSTLWTCKSSHTNCVSHPRESGGQREVSDYDSHLQSRLLITAHAFPPTTNGHSAKVTNWTKNHDIDTDWSYTSYLNSLLTLWPPLPSLPLLPNRRNKLKYLFHGNLYFHTFL